MEFKLHSPAIAPLLLELLLACGMGGMGEGTGSSGKTGARTGEGEGSVVWRGQAGRSPPTLAGARVALYRRGGTVPQIRVLSRNNVWSAVKAPGLPHSAGIDPAKQ